MVLSSGVMSDLLGNAREFRKKHAAAITNLEQTIETLGRKQAQQETEPRTLDGTEQRSKVPVGVVDRPGLDERFFRQKVKVSDHGFKAAEFMRVATLANRGPRLL